MANRKKTAPKKHHYLPQFYLERFRSDTNDKEPKINIIPKNKRPLYTYIAAIKDTGCETDYHTIETNEGEKDRSSIETNLSKIEYAHNELIKNIIEKKEIDTLDKAELISFLLLMRMRVPSNKRHLEELLKATVQSTFNILDKSRKLPPKPKIIQDALDKGINPIKIEIANWKLVLEMFRQSQNENLLAEHYKLNITLCESKHSDFFITSDTPVSIYFPHHKVPYGAPLFADDTELFLPISKHFGILFHNKSTLEKYILLNKNQVKEYNRRTIIMANKYIYLSKVDEEIIRLVKLNWNKNAGQKLDVIDYGEGSYMIGRIMPVTD